MALFRELSDIAIDASNLQAFVVDNIHKFHELYDSDYAIISLEKDDIRDFIENKSNLLEHLNYELFQCKSFISILFDFCEKFGFLCTARIENTIRKKELYVGKRREAAKLYLLGIRNNQEYVDRFEAICSNLQTAIDTEEDNEKKALATFISYYAKVLNDTTYYAPQFIQSIIEKIYLYRAEEFSFLKHDCISLILSLGIADVDTVYLQLQILIEEILAKRRIALPDTNEFLIEADTEYADMLSMVGRTFNALRKVSVRKYMSFDNQKQKKLKNELKRGVEVIADSDLMYSYLHSVGNMHHAKMKSALYFLPFRNLNSSIEIIDWGCGQAIASITYFECINERNVEVNNLQITLIEPSEECIKRATLHVKHFNEIIEIKTICKDIDSLSKNDLISFAENTKIHLFSNILDVEGFSISRLISLIEVTQKGENYFVCVSPYIEDIKNDRVDSFMRHFTKYDSFKLLGQETDSKLGTYWNCNNKYSDNGLCRDHDKKILGYCKGKWSRVIRVFSVDFNSNNQ